MKVSVCPRCHKSGFVSLRPVKKWNQRYPYIGHYDSRRYQKEKGEYESGRRTSKPSGRSWHSIHLHDLLNIQFEDEWYHQYQELIDKIFEKYRRYGFKNEVYITKMLGTPSSEAYLTEEFVTNEPWDSLWKDAVHMLRKNDFPNTLIRLRIFYDLWRKDLKDVVLLASMPPFPRKGHWSV